MLNGKNEFPKKMSPHLLGPIRNPISDKNLGGKICRMIRTLCK